MKHSLEKATVGLSLLALLLFPIKTESQREKHYRRNHTPTLTTYWTHDKEKTFSRYESYYKKASVFDQFDQDFFESHMIPNESITYRNSISESVDGTRLSELAEQALQEIQMGARKLTHFTVLKTKNYDFKDQTGLIVLKYNDYPFIIKIFRETPESFLLPDNKGLQHKGMSLISGGMNRYLSGLYRIKNMEILKEEMARNEIWSDFIDFPRKWNWLPKKVDWFEVEGKQFETQETFYTQLPNTYAIIVDEIISDVRLAKVKKQYGRSIFNFCKALKWRPDPNIKNFMIERGTNKLVCIDTEYFADLIGMDPDKGQQLHGHWDLHVYAASRFFEEEFKSVM